MGVGDQVGVRQAVGGRVDWSKGTGCRLVGAWEEGELGLRTPRGRSRRCLGPGWTVPWGAQCVC